MRSISDAGYDGGGSGRSHGRRTRRLKIKLPLPLALAVAKMSFVYVLRTGKPGFPVPAWVIARWPLPCWYGKPASGPGEVREAEASGAVPADDDSDDDSDAGAQAA